MVAGACAVLCCAVCTLDNLASTGYFVSSANAAQRKVPATFTGTFVDSMLPLSELPMTKGVAIHHHSRLISPTPFFPFSPLHLQHFHSLLLAHFSIPRRKPTAQQALSLPRRSANPRLCIRPSLGTRLLDAYCTVTIATPRRPILRPGSDPVDAAAPALKLCDLDSAAWLSPMLECQFEDVFRLGNSPHPHPSVMARLAWPAPLCRLSTAFSICHCPLRAFNGMQPY